jgi:hypothetical protein
MASEPPPGLRSSILTLEGLLGRAWRLRAPRYQRPFSWTENEVGRLFEDLLDGFRANRRFYFLGTAVVIFQDGKIIAEIVDGQQRMCTLSILVASLRDRVGGADRAALELLISSLEGPRLSLRPSDEAFMARYVYTPGQIKALAALDEDPRRPPPQAKLVDAARAIEAAFDAAVTPKDKDRAPLDLAAFARFVRNCAVFNLLEIEDRDEAPRMFAVLNETGMDLSIADLVKADLFTRANYTDDEADAIAARWDDWVNRLGPKGMETLLAVVPSIVSGKVVEATDIRDFRQLVLGVVNPRGFLERELPALVEGFLQVRGGDVQLGDVSAEINRRIQIMRWLKDTFWVGPAFAILAIHRDNPALVRDAFIRLERFAFAGMMAVVTAHEQTRRRNRIFAALHDANKLVGAGGVFDLTAAEQKQLLEKLKIPYRRDHGRRRLIVLRANAAFGEMVDPEAEANVEHVLPQAVNGTWAVLFKYETLHDFFINNLGNLTLLTPAQNRLAGDKSYDDKRDIFYNTEGAPVRALTQLIKANPSWTPDVIRKRTNEIVEQMLKDWRMA